MSETPVGVTDAPVHASDQPADVSEPPMVSRPSAAAVRDRVFGRWLITPAVVVIGTVSLIPFLFAIWVSFVQYNLRSSAHPFVGLDNFAHVLGDPIFRRSLVFTILLGAGLALLQLVIGTGLAILLHGRPPAWRRALMPIIVAPMFLSPVVVGQIWRLFMSRGFGPFNYLVSSVIGRPLQIDFLADRYWNLIPIIAADVWQWTPLPFVIAFAALSGIDTEILEAATVDGAGGWARVRHIILPLAAPALLTALFFRFADAIRIYGTIFMLSRGGPGRTTTPIAQYLVERGFTGSFDLGIAGAASWIFLIVVSLLFYRLVRRVVLV